MRCCMRDEGFVAPRSRPAGGGFKPPHAALAEDRRGFRSLLAHPALAAVIVPSRAEPFGRIPLEAYAAGASPVIATTAGGLAEIVTESRTGYTAPPADPRSLARAISRALAASPAQRRRLLDAGRQLTRDRFDYQANVTAFLNAVAP